MLMLQATFKSRVETPQNGKKQNMGVSKNSGTLNWMVKIRETSIKMDDLGGPPLFLETPTCFFFGSWVHGKPQTRKKYDERLPSIIHQELKKIGSLFKYSLKGLILWLFSPINTLKGLIKVIQTIP